MARVVIVGGGWAGTAAAVAARKAGASRVILLERTDMLLGTGLVGGIMRNNGRFTAAEELIAMGAGDLIRLTDQVARHKNIDFPGHKHATLYDVVKIEPLVRSYLRELGIDVRLQSRVRQVEAEGPKLNAAITDTWEIVSGEVFVDATGTAGPQSNCSKYGNGCAMCIMRCPSFGPRISLAAQMGIDEIKGLRGGGGVGAFSGSCKLNKDSLGEELRQQLDSKGVAVLSLPPGLRKGQESLRDKACQQYALTDYAESLVILDTGHAKLMTPYFPVDLLRQIKGLERARYEDPYSGGTGNSVRYMAVSPRDNTMKVSGAENLFCGGEKAGLYVGHTEAIVTGTLAGHNAVRLALGRELLELPRSLAIGELVAFGRERMAAEEGLRERYTFSGSVFFSRMEKLGLYSCEPAVIYERVKKVGMLGVFTVVPISNSSRIF
jgi:hypothetical protein